MLPTFGLIIGAILGALIARKRKGNFLDMLQYAIGYGILLFFIGLFISIYIIRVFG